VAFKAQELMIQVLPGQGMWAACHNDMEPGDSQKCPGVVMGSICPEDSHICGRISCEEEATNPPCLPPSEVPCLPNSEIDTCHNDTNLPQGIAGLSSLDLLRQQMRERLSRELLF
jgi:hypothetical protein